MVNWKERIKMNMISGYIYGSVKWTGKLTYQVASKLAGTFIFGWVCQYADQQMS